MAVRLVISHSGDDTISCFTQLHFIVSYHVTLHCTKFGLIVFSCLLFCSTALPSLCANLFYCIIVSFPLFYSNLFCSILLRRAEQAVDVVGQEVHMTQQQLQQTGGAGSSAQEMLSGLVGLLTGAESGHLTPGDVVHVLRVRVWLRA